MRVTVVSVAASSIGKHMARSRVLWEVFKGKIFTRAPMLRGDAPLAYRYAAACSSDHPFLPVSDFLDGLTFNAASYSDIG